MPQNTRKITRTDHQDDEASIDAQKKQIKNFLKEVRHLRKLSASPNIPNLLGFGEVSEDTPWYAAEYFKQDLRIKLA